MRLFRFLLYLSVLLTACEQKPADSGTNPYTNTYREYYSSVTGKKGSELKTALFEIIGNPDVLSYAEVWSAFEKTDVKADGSVWDMYSDNPGGKAAYSFSFHQKRCGTYRREGDCYNREHAIPQSWFKGASPMYSDLFHLYPTDGYVNNRRGNLPLGEVGIFSWESANGSRVGQNTSGNFVQTVFEPVDEYKGDFARTYFYMVTAYENDVADWRSPQIGGNSYPAIRSWALEMFLRWHREDPVSEKERNRNNAVFAIQNNRNPFIDHPELAEHVWGNKKDRAFSIK